MVGGASACAPEPSPSMLSPSMLGAVGQGGEMARSASPRCLPPLADGHAFAERRPVPDPDDWSGFRLRLVLMLMCALRARARARIRSRSRIRVRIRIRI